MKCPFCGYEMETEDRYGCPNCNGEGLEDEEHEETETDQEAEQ